MRCVFLGLRSRTRSSLGSHIWDFQSPKMFIAGTQMLPMLWAFSQAPPAPSFQSACFKQWVR
jgi:hypothetical protein